MRWWRKPWLTVKRFVGFSVCNIPGTLIELLLVWLCSNYLFHQYFGRYVVAPFIGFECAVVMNFMLYSRFVWRDRMRGVGLRGNLLRLLGYNASAVGVYLLRMVIIQIIGLLWHWQPVVCDMVSLLFSGILSYMALDGLVFRHKRRKKCGKSPARVCPPAQDPDVPGGSLL